MGGIGGALFTLYAVKVLGLTAGTASLMLMFFTVALLVAAIPAGIMGTRCGRRASILVGLTGTAVLFAPVNINALPMVAEIANSSRIGRYTGYYFFFMSLAAIIGPTMFGWIRDLTQNYAILFTFAGAAYAAAAVCMVFVRHGEATHEKRGP